MRCKRLTFLSRTSSEAGSTCRPAPRVVLLPEPLFFKKRPTKPTKPTKLTEGTRGVPTERPTKPPSVRRNPAKTPEKMGFVGFVGSRREKGNRSVRQRGFVGFRRV